MSDPARAILPAEPKFLPPWGWLPEHLLPAGYHHDYWVREKEEGAEAAEECRLALYLAMRHLPPIYYENCRATPIYDTQSAAVEEEVPF